MDEEPKRTDHLMRRGNLVGWILTGLLALIWVGGGYALIHSLLESKDVFDKLIYAALVVLFALLSPAVVAFGTVVVGTLLILCEQVNAGCEIVLASARLQTIASAIIGVFFGRAPHWFTSMTVGLPTSLMNDLGKFLEAEMLLSRACQKLESSGESKCRLWRELKTILAETYLRKGELDAANRCAREALDGISPSLLNSVTEFSGYRRLAQIAAAKELFVDAEQNYMRALSALRGPQVPAGSFSELEGDLLIELSWMFCKSNQYTKALQAAEASRATKKVELMRGEFGYRWHYVHAMVALNEERVDEALEHLELAAKLIKLWGKFEVLDDAQLKEGLAQIYARKGENEKAAEFFRESIRLTNSILKNQSHPVMIGRQERYRELLARGDGASNVQT